MSGEIFDFTDPFPFSTLQLGAPIKKGSGYTIQLSMDHERPIYLQPPKCLVKDRLKAGPSTKNAYCDLLFGMENDKFISWAEEMERVVISRIYDRRTDWFDVADASADMSKEDIQSYLQPIGKSYKSGRMYLVRTTYTPTELRIWDENEHPVEHDALEENSRVVVILQLKQLNCSSTSFQFVFELKQMMLSPERKANFERCLIKKANPSPMKENEDKDLGKAESVPEPSVIECNSTSPEIVSTRGSSKKPNVEEVDLDLAELEGENMETMHLIDPNEVYFKMYKEARRKMKEAKIIALSNYLEAKRIRTTYLADMQLDEEDSGEE